MLSFTACLSLMSQPIWKLSVQKYLGVLFRSPSYSCGTDSIFFWNLIDLYVNKLRINSNLSRNPAGDFADF